MLCKTEDDLSRATTKASGLVPVLSLSSIEGSEYTVSILGHDVPVIQIETNNPFYDYDAKYIPGKRSITVL